MATAAGGVRNIHDLGASPTLPLNWDDLDPVSLEPVCSVWPYFEIAEHDNTAQHDESGPPTVRRYDAWAWLEMMRRDTTGQYKHPVTGERLGVKARAACVRACLQSRRQVNVASELGTPHPCASTTASSLDESRLFDESRAWMLASCGTSLEVKRVDVRDHVTGRLHSVQFYAVDPSFEVVVTAAWARFDDADACPAWAAAVRSHAAARYELQDCSGRIAAHRTLWFG